MASVSKTIVLGRLGKDPESQTTSGGKTVCRFSVATTESWTNANGEKTQDTEWHRVVAWGKLAETCNKYLAKGRQCFVEGKNKTRSYENKEGVKVYTTEVVANKVQFLDPINDQGSIGDEQKEELDNFAQGNNW